MMPILLKKKLIKEDSLQAFYVINKHIKGGTIVKSDRVLEDTDTITMLGTFIGG